MVKGSKMKTKEEEGWILIPESDIDLIEEHLLKIHRVLERCAQRSIHLPEPNFADLSVDTAINPQDIF